MAWHSLLKLSVLGVSLALAACAATERTSTVPVTQNQPVYTVLSDLDYVPYIMEDDKGYVTGLEADILRAIARNQGFRIEYKKDTWDTLFDDMQGKGAHIASNGMAINDVNQEVAHYSQPYLRSLDCVATLTPDAAWQKGKIAIVLEGNLPNNLKKQYNITEKQFTKVESQQNGLATLVAKKAQSAVGDCTALRYYASHEANLKAHTLHIKELASSGSSDNSNLVFAVRKDQTELLNKINAGLKAIEQSGELAAIKRKWGQQ